VLSLETVNREIASSDIGTRLVPNRLVKVEVARRVGLSPCLTLRFTVTVTLLRAVCAHSADFPLHFALLSRWLLRDAIGGISWVPEGRGFKSRPRYTSRQQIRAANSLELVVRI
jgi:hypothetical protein